MATDAARRLVVCNSAPPALGKQPLAIPTEASAALPVARFGRAVLASHLATTRVPHAPSSSTVGTICHPSLPQAHVPAQSRQIILPYFGWLCGTIWIALFCFSYVTVHARPGTSASLQLVDPHCSWMDQFKGLNPFGCFSPRFVSQPAVASTKDAGTCGGPLITLLFDAERGTHAWVAYDGAVAMARALRERASRIDACGTADGAPAKAHVCFAHATRGDTLDAFAATRFAGCLVQHEAMACRAELCA